MAGESESDGHDAGGRTKLATPEVIFEDSADVVSYTPSARLRSLYSEMTATFNEVEKMLTPIVPLARQAELLVNVEGDPLRNFFVFYELATEEMRDALKRVCDVLRECYSDSQLP